MRVERELLRVPMRPDEALAVIRDSYRFAAALDPEAETGVDLTPGTTVAEWRQACDLVGTRALGRALNGWFRVTATDAEWRPVLEPSDQATLAEVCRLVAANGAERPVAPPARLAGGECAAAGAFLAIRALIAREGGDAAGLRPSTPLAALRGRELGPLVQAIGKLAPGLLPVPRAVSSRPWRMSGWLLGTSVLALPLASVVDAQWYPSACFAGIAAAMLGLAVSHRIWPERYEYAEPTTFGALARAVVRHHTPSA